MELITFESQVYHDLIKKIDSIAKYVITSKQKEDEECDEPQHEVWLNNLEAANLLQISTRTLQRLRSKKRITYSLLQGKCYYRLSDIEQCLNERSIIREPEQLIEFKKNYMLKNGIK